MKIIIIIVNALSKTVSEKSFSWFLVQFEVLVWIKEEKKLIKIISVLFLNLFLILSPCLLFYRFVFIGKLKKLERIV